MGFDSSAGFGQHYEVDSVIHRLDPRAKLFFMLFFLISTFVAKDIFAFIFMTAVAVISILLSKVPFRIVLKGLKPIVVIVIFTTILNVFWVTGEKPLVSLTVIPNFWTINIFKEGVFKAGIMALRVVTLLACTSVYFSYATTPLELTDGIDVFFSPLKKIKVPVHEFAMMMTIALRFIPTLMDETGKIMNAQKARGADFSSGGLIKRAKALIPIIIPLFISAFRRADELATAMECRCYRGGEGRTRLKVMKLVFTDYLWIFFGACVLAGVILINIFAKGYKI
jgi:energy-coupling factor transport system permease protein